MYSFENKLACEGFCAICGIDEAGCGPLAGPVYASAVILSQDDVIEGLDDSKKLSEKKREILFEQIQKRALDFSIAHASAEEIDEINILQARLLAMRRALQGLNVRPDFALVDGNRDPDLGINTLCIVKGDGLSASIAAASILAKVSRDRYMCLLAEEFPQYGFDVHKGYPTKKHRELILKYGPCPQHRRTFLKKLYGGDPV